MAKRISSTDKAPNRSDVSQRPDSNQEPHKVLSRRARVVISVLVIYHLAAVFVGAWNAVPNDSFFAQATNRLFYHYIHLADLNHGYRFFAPDPGPSHLFRYTLTMPDGTTQRGFFPNREEQWPRLLYHRHFMLSEQIVVLLPGGPGPEELPGVSNARPTDPPAEAFAGFDAMAKSYAAHILRERGATRIHWSLERHLIPSHEQVQAGRPLTDPELYIKLRSGVVTREEIE